MMPTPIEHWHQIVKSRDLAALKALLADDVVFESPVVHTPQAGKAITTKYLQAAMHVLGNVSFRYLNQWYGPSSAVLEFQSSCEGIVINGVDMISWNAAGQISHFKVMVRPLKAVNKLHELMGRLLLGGGSSQAPGP
jgi:SnoaL-like domain